MGDLSKEFCLLLSIKKSTFYYFQNRNKTEVLILKLKLTSVSKRTICPLHEKELLWYLKGTSKNFFVIFVHTSLYNISVRFQRITYLIPDLLISFQHNKNTYNKYIKTNYVRLLFFFHSYIMKFVRFMMKSQLHFKINILFAYSN